MVKRDDFKAVVGIPACVRVGRRREWGSLCVFVHYPNLKLPPGYQVLELGGNICTERENNNLAAC